MKGKLPPVVFTTTSLPASGFNTSAHSAELRSGPTRLNFASSFIRCPVANQDHEQQVVARQPTAQPAEDATDVVTRGPADRSSFGFREHEDVVVRVVELLLQRQQKRRAPLVVFFRVHLSTRGAGDNDGVAVRGLNGWCEQDENNHQTPIITERRSQFDVPA